VLARNAFIGRTECPTDDDLSQALGPAKSPWDLLLADLANEHGVSNLQWKSYSRKAGWSVRALLGKRTIVWMTPCENCFRVTFILGDKAMHAARASGLACHDAKKYPEGWAVSLEIQNTHQLAEVMKLSAIKLAN
jgi:hypothetical protein